MELKSGSNTTQSWLLEWKTGTVQSQWNCWSYDRQVESYAVRRMMWTPESVVTGSLSSPTFKANAACSNGLCMAPRPNGPRSPPRRAELQSENFCANSAKEARPETICSRYAEGKDTQDTSPTSVQFIMMLETKKHTILAHSTTCFIMVIQKIWGGLTLHCINKWELGMGFIYRGLWKMNEVWLWKRSISLCGNSMRKPGGRGPWLGTLKDMRSKTLEMGICFHRGPSWGTWRGFVYQDFWLTDEGGLWKWCISY